MGELYDAVGQRAYALARRVLGDPAAAEDAVHEAFAQLWERAATLEPVGRIDSLVMTMVHRRAIDAVRRRRGARVPVGETGRLAQIDERAEAAFEEVDAAGLLFFAVFAAYAHEAMAALFDGLAGGYPARSVRDCGRSWRSCRRSNGRWSTASTSSP